MHAELGVSTREMTFYRALTEKKGLGDGRRSLPGHGQGYDLPLPPAQRISPGRVTHPPRPGRRAGQEGLDGIQDLVGVAQPRPVIHPGRLDEPGTSDVRGEVTAVAHIDPLLVGAVD